MTIEHALIDEIAERVAAQLLFATGRPPKYAGEFMTDRFDVAAVVSETLRDMNLVVYRP